MSKSNIFFFICGFFIGIFSWSLFNHVMIFEENEQKLLSLKHEIKVNQYNTKYNEALSNELFNEVKIVCIVMTHPANHRKNAIHVKNTWGKKCNKLLFMTSANDSELDSVVLPIKEDRDFLWSKTKRSFLYAYHNHFNDADWFLKADDDS